jgi:hypothetical protein
MKEAYSHVRRGKLGCELLSFFPLVATVAFSQDASRALVMKMVDNELKPQKHPRYWMYLDSKEPEKSELNRVVQTPECSLFWPVAAIGEQQHEVRSQFRPVPSDISPAEAASRMAGDSRTSQMGWLAGSQ